MDIMENYDYQIIELFKKIGHIKSDNQVAVKLGISRMYISKIKSGKIRISEKNIINMAKLAGIKITEAWAKRCEKRIIDHL